MKKIIYIIIIGLAIFFVVKGFSWEGINPSQPLSMGDAIYHIKGSPVPGKIPVTYFGETYTYLGIDGKNLLVGYESDIGGSSASGPKEEAVKLYKLPLNDKRQALLEIVQYSKERTAADKRQIARIKYKKYLLISVVDELGHIRVEEYDSNLARNMYGAGGAGGSW